MTITMPEYCPIPDGIAAMERNPAGCVTCHAGLKSNNYVVVRPWLKAPDRLP
jgi:hypothetical protein